MAQHRSPRRHRRPPRPQPARVRALLPSDRTEPSSRSCNGPAVNLGQGIRAAPVQRTGVCRRTARIRPNAARERSPGGARRPRQPQPAPSTRLGSDRAARYCPATSFRTRATSIGSRSLSLAAGSLPDLAVVTRPGRSWPSDSSDQPVLGDRPAPRSPGCARSARPALAPVKVQRYSTAPLSRRTRSSMKTWMSGKAAMNPCATSWIPAASPPLMAIVPPGT